MRRQLASLRRRVEELAASGEPGVILEIQELYASLLGLRRDPATGRYPERDERDAHALRLAEYLRRAGITAAVERGIRVITTNSDSDAARRRFLLGELGSGATERIVTVDYDVAHVAACRGPTAQLRSNAGQRWNGGTRGGDVETLLCEITLPDRRNPAIAGAVGW